MVKREISDILHTLYRDTLPDVTVIDVSVTPDLRQAHIYYSVLGDENRALDIRHFFTANHKAIRRELSRRIILKYLPHLHFHQDESIERGNRVIELLDDLDHPNATDPEDTTDTQP